MIQNPPVSTKLKAFDFAQDVVKQLITLATGIIVITITFLTEVFSDTEGVGWLQIAWGLYFLSIPFGIASLMNMTGNLNSDNPDIGKASIRTFAGLQIVIFMAGLACTGIFGIRAT